MAELTDAQRDTLIRTVLGEARGEGLDGMAAVAQVIQNRANSGKYPSDPAEVALQPYQFSTWLPVGSGGNNPQQFSPNSNAYQQAAQVVDSVFSGQVPDRTNGALFYHTPQVSPNWANSVNRYGTTQLGNHIFYNGRPTPPGEIPNQVASWTDTIRPSTPNPATQSKALSSQRSLIPSSGSDALKSAMARLAGQSVRNVSPATQSPDLAQMRNPIMSSSARQAQVTPYPATQSLDLAIRRAPGETIDTVPTSGIGAPPATRSVQSIPMTGNNQSAMVEATRRAALLANQSNVERNPVPQNRQALVQDAARRAALTANQSYAGMDRAPPLREARLSTPPIPRITNVALNQAPLQVNAPPRFAPMPLMASAGLQNQRMMPRGAPAMVRPSSLPMASQAPLRVIVNGANSYRQPVVQSLQSQGTSPSQAYSAANAQAAQQARENASSPAHVSSNSWFNEVTGRG